MPYDWYGKGSQTGWLWRGEIDSVIVLGSRSRKSGSQRGEGIINGMVEAEDTYLYLFPENKSFSVNKYGLGRTIKIKATTQSKQTPKSPYTKNYWGETKMAWDGKEQRSDQPHRVCRHDSQWCVLLMQRTLASFAAWS